MQSADFLSTSAYAFFQILVFGLALAGDGCIAVNVLFGARRNLHPCFWGGCVGFGHCAVAFLAFVGASRWMQFLEDGLLLGFLLLLFLIIQLAQEALEVPGEDKEHSHGLSLFQGALICVFCGFLVKGLRFYFPLSISCFIVISIMLLFWLAFAGIERLREFVTCSAKLPRIGFVLLGFLFSADSSIQGVVLASESIPVAKQSELMRKIKLHENEHGPDASLVKLVSRDQERLAVFITLGIGVAVAFWTTIFSYAVQLPAVRAYHGLLQFLAIGFLIRFAIGDFLWRYLMLRDLAPWDSGDSFKCAATGIAILTMVTLWYLRPAVQNTSPQ